MKQLLALCFFLFSTKLLSSQEALAPGLLVPAYPCACCYAEEPPGLFYAKASGLVWQSKMGGLEFAAQSLLPTETSTPVSLKPLQEKLSIPDFAWRPGFKLDVGGHLPYDGWDLDLRWTFYRGTMTSLKKHFHSQIEPPGVGIIPLWFYPFSRFVPAISGGDTTANPIRYASAAANWNLYFNSVDLELGRFSFLHPSLPFRISIGAKGAWIHHYYHVLYHSGTTVRYIPILPEEDEFTLQLVSSRFAYSQRSWSIGPRLGFDSRWPIRWGLGFIGNGAASLLYSSFRTTIEFNDHGIQEGEVLEPRPVFPSLHREERFLLLEPVVETQLGLFWKKCFGPEKNSYAFDAMILYEIQYWWAQNHSRRNYGAMVPGTTFASRGDLQMHGLTAVLRLDF